MPLRLTDHGQQDDPELQAHEEATQMRKVVDCVWDVANAYDNGEVDEEEEELRDGSSVFAAIQHEGKPNEPCVWADPRAASGL